MKTIPQPTLQPIDVLFDYGKVLIPTIVTGLMAGATIMAIVAGTPRHIDTNVSYDQDCRIELNHLVCN